VQPDVASAHGLPWFRLCSQTLGKKYGPPGSHPQRLSTQAPQPQWNHAQFLQTHEVPSLQGDHWRSEMLLKVTTEGRTASE